MSSKMFKYVAKRLLLAVVTLLIIITLTFFIMHAVPSSPFIKQKALTQSVIDALNAKYGLDKPLGEQYLIYLKNIVQFDFGDSIYYKGRGVMELILDGFKSSAVIGLSAAALALVLGVVLGCVAALKRGKWVDKTILVVTTASVSLPSFVIATILLWLFCVNWKVFPSRGDTFAGLILPIIALSLYPASYITRLMRSSMLDVLGQDYIRTANAKGVKKGKVIFKHAMKNALTPVITYAGPMIAYIVTGSFVVEKIFSIGGLGKYFVDSIQNSDYTMIMGTTIFLSMLMILMNLISDILYKVLDKRVDFS